MYYTIKPGEALADYVQFFWVLEGEASMQRPFVHRALAEHCAELIFYYKGGFTKYSNDAKPVKTFTAGLFAQSRCFSLFETADNYSMFGVYLYPYAIPLLLKTPANEFSNHAVDLKTLLGKDGEMIEERIMLAVDNFERTKIVSDFLLHRLKNSKNKYPAITSCIQKAVQYNSFNSVGMLIDYCNLSRRQFERKFKEQSGFSPKDFLRLVRFTTSLKSPEKISSLAKLAIDCGYYDQSHFIHDFTMFSGYTPAKFFRREIDPESYRALAEPNS
jgi:AraC-like DNA-binding protein